MSADTVANVEDLENAPQFMTVDLFGGAIRMEIPEDFIDASDFRQIPDNQEVYVANDTSESSDNSIIVELVERLESETANVSHKDADISAVRAHYEEIATINSSLFNTKVLGVEPLDAPKGATCGTCPATAYMITGVQIAEKWGRSTTADLRYLILTLAVIRLREQKTDILISLNSAVHCDENTVLSFSEDMNVDPSAMIRIAYLKTVCKHIAESFTVVNWDLFVD